MHAPWGCSVSQVFQMEDIEYPQGKNKGSCGARGGGARGNGKGKSPPQFFFCLPQDGSILCKQLMALHNFKTWPIY